MLELQKRGSETFDYGNNIRGEAYAHGLEEAFGFPGFVFRYIRPLFCEGKGPFRWAALSNAPEDIKLTDKYAKILFDDDGIEASTMPNRNHFYAELALPVGSDDIFVFWKVKICITYIKKDVCKI